MEKREQKVSEREGETALDNEIFADMIDKKCFLSLFFLSLSLSNTHFFAQLSSFPNSRVRFSSGEIENLIVTIEY